MAKMTLVQNKIGPQTLDNHQPTPTEITASEYLDSLERIINRWNGNEVIASYHAPTRAWIFIAIHDTTLGPATGGCRILRYDSPAEGLRDAMRLAECMTSKWVILRSPAGGAKCVVTLADELGESARASLLEYVGHIIECLQGRFQTAGDLGTDAADLQTMAKFTRYIHCFDHRTGGYIDSGIYTALGVFAGIKSALHDRFGSSNLNNRHILIQGIGHVGGQLARLLHRDGARVVISDIDQRRTRELANELQCVVIPHESVRSFSCDVFSPCAVGSVIGVGSAEEMRCGIVAGGANNQLTDDAVVSDELHRKDILYAPDFVINGGGAVALPMFFRGASENEVRNKVEEIGHTLSTLFAEASLLDESPYQVARRRSQLILKEARAFA